VPKDKLLNTFVFSFKQHHHHHPHLMKILVLLQLFSELTHFKIMLGYIRFFFKYVVFAAFMG